MKQQLTRDDANYTESTVTFRCDGCRLFGILAQPHQSFGRGVLIVVGGPQYRVGSHRQFTLLARELAARGTPVLRFDYRGMGDSEGDRRTFEAIGMDIRTAIDAFLELSPRLGEVVIWGLCDAASAALFYAYQDPRVTGLVLLNPWVRTEQGIARAHLRHYYGARLFQASLWRKVVRGELSFHQTGTALRKLIVDAMDTRSAPGAVQMAEEAPLPERMEEGLRRFRGRVLLILSGNDMTAREFKDLIAGSRRWQNLLADARVTRHELHEANHTFARSEWAEQVARLTAEWVQAST